MFHLPERYKYLFQSTLSVRRATTKVLFLSNAVQFQSTLSVRRATGVVPRPYA